MGLVYFDQRFNEKWWICSIIIDGDDAIQMILKTWNLIVERGCNGKVPQWIRTAYAAVDRYSMFSALKELFFCDL